MATPPTFVAEYEGPSWSTTTTPKTVAVTTAAGDVLVVVGGHSDSASTSTTPTGNSLTYALQQSVVVTAYSSAYAWVAADAAGGTGWTLSDARDNGAARPWGFTSARFSGSDGVGASSKTNVASGAPTLDVTTQYDNSAIVVICEDWTAADGASRTWRTVNGSTPTSGNGLELVYVNVTDQYTVYVAYYPDSGAAGTKTVGLSAPTGQKYSIVAVEVRGTAGTTPVAYDHGAASDAITVWSGLPRIDAFTQSASDGTTAVSSLTLTKPSGVRPGDLLVIIAGNDDATGTAQFDDSTLKPTGFTLINETGDSTADCHAAAFYRVADGSEGSTVAVPAQSTQDMWGFYLRVVYAGFTVPLDATGADASVLSSSAFDVTGVTSTVANCLVIGYGAYDGADATTETTTGTGWETRGFARAGTGSANASGVWGSRDMPAAGASGTVTFNADVADGWACSSFSIAPYGGVLLQDRAVQAGVAYGPMDVFGVDGDVRVTSLLNPASGIYSLTVTTPTGVGVILTYEISGSPVSVSVNPATTRVIDVNAADPSIINSIKLFPDPNTDLAAGGGGPPVEYFLEVADAGAGADTVGVV